MIRLLGTWRSPRNRSPQFPFLHPPNRAQASHKNLYMKNHYTAEARRNDMLTRLLRFLVDIRLSGGGSRILFWRLKE